ncbi:porin OmpC [Candidatus Pantoea soli]|uniref:Porin n=1 Tax=Candidatus Pantoea soli TaxID=3098669 RepID=A0A518XA91_9GAMM|nr:porin OmpC [Pantoea soli]QDY41114.1 porin [Pantoea soli]
MKKSTLALVVSALALASTAQAAEIYNKDGNKLDLYGRVKGMHYFSDNPGADGDKTYIRLGFKGQTQINDLMTGYGQWEYQFQGNRAETNTDANIGNKTRLGFAGLKFGNYGSVDYGRNYGVVYDVLAWTDVLPEFGGDSAYTDTYMLGRTSGVATYRNSNFFGLVDGLRFAVQYQGKNDTTSANGRSDVTKQNGDGYGASLGYTLGDTGISLMSAISSADRTNSQDVTTRLGRGDKAEAWGAGIKYDANSIYLASTYSETRNMTPITGGVANKTQNFEVVAQYQFDFGLRPSLAYVQSKGKDIEGIGDADIVKYVDVAMTYYFNKNMSAMVDYKINQLDDNNPLNINNDDVVAVGLTYQF